MFNKHISIYLSIISIVLVPQIGWCINHEEWTQLYMRIPISIFIGVLLAFLYVRGVDVFFRQIRLLDSKFFVNLHLVLMAVWFGLFVPRDFQNEFYISLSIVYLILVLESIHAGSISNSHKAIIELALFIFIGVVYVASPILYTINFGKDVIQAPVYNIVLLLNLVLLSSIYAVIYILRRVHYVSSVVLGIVVINIIFLLNVFSVGVLQATGFELGPTVFIHAGAQAVLIVIEEYWLYLLALLTVVSLFSWFFVKTIRKHSFEYSNHATALLVIVLFCIYALTSHQYNLEKMYPFYGVFKRVSEYLGSDYSGTKKFLDEVRYSEGEFAVLDTLGLRSYEETRLNKLKNAYSSEGRSDKPNLIVIYLESFQHNFTAMGNDIYPELTPYIDHKMPEFTRVTNFYNSVTPTINAVISSQCGTSMFLPGDMALDELNGVPKPKDTIDDDKYIRKLVGKGLYCLSDVLRENGYYQVFMKGARIEYSGKQEFLKLHNYNEQLGHSQLNADGKYTEVNTWGLYDRDLYDEVINKLDSLKKNQPFNLTLLTLDSHFPGYASKDCIPYKINNTLLNAIHCTDQMLGKFIDKLRSRGYLENTVVVIMGDHTSFPSRANLAMVSDKIMKSLYGQVFFSFYSPHNVFPKKMDVYAQTPDLAPTVLDLLGIRHDVFVSGRSVVSDRKDYQHIVTKAFEVKDEIVNFGVDDWEACGDDDVLKAVLEIGSKPLSVCQRRKVYLFEQKQLYRFDIKELVQ